MNIPAPPLKSSTPAPVTTDEPRKLDDVLLAMDVVDTIRHRERVVDVELDAEAREAQLIARLKEIYDAQGIQVPDRILKDGVKALEEQRFNYKPAEGGLSVKLARLYVRRKQWLPGTVTFIGAVAALLVGWQVFWAMPQAAAAQALPRDLLAAKELVVNLAVDPAVDQQAEGIYRVGVNAVESGDRSEAKQQLGALKDMGASLRQEYSVRIVSRPGEATGVFRVPNDIPNGRNYYLVVEAIAPGGGKEDVVVVNQETQKAERVDIWGQRVTEDTYNKVAADKGDDQIVENDVLGYKARGELKPKFDAGVLEGAITEW